MLTTWDGSGVKLIRSWTGVLPATSKTASTVPPAAARTRAAIDKERVAGLDVEQPKPTFAGLTGHACRGGDRPVDGRRLGRPGVQHGVLGLGVPAAAEHLVP